MAVDAAERLALEGVTGGLGVTGAAKGTGLNQGSVDAAPVDAGHGDAIFGVAGPVRVARATLGAV
jgi:hypothetical protein